MTIADMIQESHETAVSKGWWEKDRTFGDQIALMHSELSEALEEFRRWGILVNMMLYAEGPSGTKFSKIEPGQKPEGVAAELADVLIRIGDTCGKYSVPLEEALRLKLAYNKSRPHRHGGKQL